MFLLLSNLALLSQSRYANNANQSNHTHSQNHTYQVVMEQYNSSNCSVPFQNFSFNFTCPTHLNTSSCCAEEYEKLNTSFGNALCSQYEDNDTYVHFLCQLHTTNSSNSSKSHNPYVVAGIAAGAIILIMCFVAFLSWMLIRCRRNPYGSL